MSNFFYLVRAAGCVHFKFGISDNPDQRLRGYRTIMAAGFERLFVLKHPRASNVERCVQEFLAAKGALVYHADTGRASEMAAAGEGDCNLLTALRLALDMGAELCAGGTPAPATANAEVVPGCGTKEVTARSIADELSMRLGWGEETAAYYVVRVAAWLRSEAEKMIGQYGETRKTHMSIARGIYNAAVSYDGIIGREYDNDMDDGPDYKYYGIIFSAVTGSREGSYEDGHPMNDFFDGLVSGKRPDDYIGMMADAMGRLAKYRGSAI